MWLLELVTGDSFIASEILKDLKIALYFLNLRRSHRIGLFFLVVELHMEGSATNEATQNSLNYHQYWGFSISQAYNDKDIFCVNS